MRIFALLALAPLAAAPWFTEVTAASGLSGGGSAAWADYDADGQVDVLIGGALFRNRGDGTFESAALPAGVASSAGTWGDCDLDGDLDLFCFGGAFAVALNQGDGTFVKAPDLPALPIASSLGAAWVDLNRDGWLDLWVGGYETWEKEVYPDVALLNRGDGRFAEGWRQTAAGTRSGRGVTCADFDEDGWADVFVSNYRLQPNQLWRNTGQLPLEEVATERGVAGTLKSEIDYTGGIRYAVSGHTIGSAWGDLDNDGHLDLFVGNFSHPPAYQDRPMFLRNTGPPEYRFEDRSSLAKLAWQESFASPSLADFDLDGDLDLYFTTVYGGDHSVLVRNDGGWTFTDVTAEAGIAADKTYQSAWADYDNDGDLDLLTGGKLYRNDAAGGHWLKVALGGHRAATGAVVRLKLGEATLTRAVESSTGQANQNEPTLHFGLGAAAGPVTLTVTWPGGATQTVTTPVDTTIRVEP